MEKDKIDIEPICFAIGSTGVTLEQAADAFLALFATMQNEQPLVMTAPDGIPISDTEYANMGSGAWSMETGLPLHLREMK
jgi:hypothetical protein